MQTRLIMMMTAIVNVPVSFVSMRNIILPITATRADEKRLQEFRRQIVAQPVVLFERLAAFD
jgi:hypothetical protein